MESPALKKFLDEIGSTVHSLNTCCVGLSSVESGFATKPSDMDITWAPTNLVASARQSRRYAMRSALVFGAENTSAYLKYILKLPLPIWGVIPKNLDRAKRVSFINTKLGIQPAYYEFFAELLMHWRNRIIHLGSPGRPTESEITYITSISDELKSEYKNIDADRLINDFFNNTPTLKEVSTMIAITIRFVRAVDKFILPTNKADLDAWLSILGINKQIDFIRNKYPKEKAEKEVLALLRTMHPQLISFYEQYYF